LRVQPGMTLNGKVIPLKVRVNISLHMPKQQANCAKIINEIHLNSQRLKKRTEYTNYSFSSGETNFMITKKLAAFKIQIYPLFLLSGNFNPNALPFVSSISEILQHLFFVAFIYFKKRETL